MKRTAPFAAILSLAFLAPMSFADGFIVIERPPVEWRERRPVIRQFFPLEVRYHKVGVKVHGAVAVTTVEQVFHNPNSVQLEGTYLFPLPRDAAVTGFTMWMGEKALEGEVLEKDKARGIYESIVRSMRDPALLEYMGEGLFKARVFPIEANGDKKIRLTYSQTITPDNGRYRYVYPLNTEKFSAAPLAECSVRIEIESEAGLKTIFSPSHGNTSLARDGEKRAVLEWAVKNSIPNRDFVACFDVSDKDLGLAFWSYKRPTEDGYFLVTVSPRRELQSKELPAKDVVFVLDTSGSMAGDDMKELRLKQAKKAMRACLGNLNANDRFGLISFSTATRELNSELLSFTPENREKAMAFIEEQRARGGTALCDALLQALAMQSKDSARPFSVVFITDGLPTVGEQSAETIRKLVLEKAGAARIFTLGIGTEVNTVLLDSLAAATRGEREYVLDDEDIELKISNFYDKVAFPVLTDCELLFEGVWVKEVYPKRLPDLFRGGSLAVVGRYKGTGKALVKLRGKVAGEAVEHVYDLNIGAESQSLDFLPGRWASQKIGYLLEQIRLNGEHKELREEVIWLAKTYGLPTPYTSYLVVEDSAPSADSPAADNAFRKLEERRREQRGPGEGESRPSRGGAQAPGFAGGISKDKGTGRESVEKSLELGRLKKGEADGTEDLDAAAVREVMRKVAGRVFYFDGARWVDSELKDLKRVDVQVAAWSDEYFKLLKDEPELGRLLTVGERVLLAFKDKVYEVTVAK